MFVFFLFQYKKSPLSREGLPLGRAASHAGKTKERHHRNQTGSNQRRFQEEPRRFRPVRPRQLTVRPTAAPTARLQDLDRAAFGELVP